MNAWIIGGGRGIGEAIVNWHRKLGDTAWVSTRNPKNSDEREEYLQIGDMVNEDQVRQHISRILKDSNNVDAVYLCNHIPIQAFNAEIASIDWPEYATQFEGTLKPVVLVVQEILRNNEHFKNCSIVCFSSFTVCNAIVGGQFIARNISKAGLECFVKSSVKDLGKHSIRINALSVGWTSTSQLDDLEISEQGFDWGHIPIGRQASPDEIARTAVFLGSDESSYLTGTVFPVNGGAAPDFR